MASSIQRAIARNQARQAALQAQGIEDTHFSPDGGGPAPAHTNPSPAFPAQDVSVPLPVRGTMPVGTVLDSDLNIANRAFRAGPVRSAVFTNPATTAITGSSAVSKLQAQVEAAQTQSETATTAAAQATATASSVSGTANAANATATQAQSTATAAQSTANNALPTPANVSYRPVGAQPLTSVDAGASATVSVASFAMRVRTPLVSSDPSYNAGSVTGLSYKTLYYVYANDATWAGGTVTYQASTTKTDALLDDGNIFIGSILTASSSGSQTAGNNDGGAGAQSGNSTVIWPTANGHSVGSAWTNPTNAYDTDPTTAATAGSGSGFDLVLSGFFGSIPAGATVQLATDYAVTRTAGGFITTYSVNGGGSFSAWWNIGVSGSIARTVRYDTVPFTTPTLNPGLFQVFYQSNVTGGGDNSAVYGSWLVISY